MNISRRLVIAVFFLLIISFVGLLFWPFTFNKIITPISLVVWTLLRVFVLSIDQKYYWVAIILITSFFLYRRLPPLSYPAVQAEDDGDPNATMKTINYWRSLCNPADQYIQENKTLKKNLARLLLALYATKQHTSADFRLYDALQQGTIPIPERIHALLFPTESQQKGHSFKKLVQSIRNTPRKWMRHWTGQDTAEDYLMLDEILSFMETSLEMKNDDGIYQPHQH
jgi:hypothetical protein